MKKIFGQPIADEIKSKLRKEIGEGLVVPGLAVILVGDDKASHVYVSLKEKSAEQVGIHFEKFIFDSSVTEQEILEVIKNLNTRNDVHGIIVQLPLPDKFDADKIISVIDPKKDADGFHKVTLRKFLAGESNLCPVFPRAIVEMILSSKVDLKGEKAVVIVNSDLFGKILAQALSDIELIVDILKVEDVKFGATDHVKLSPRDMGRAELIRGTDVIVSVCGVPNLITSEMVRDGTIIIDGGISIVGGKVVGDIDQDSFENRDVFLSPVPKGVGPVTVACLLKRVVELAFSK